MRYINPRFTYLLKDRDGSRLGLQLRRECTVNNVIWELFW